MNYTREEIWTKEGCRCDPQRQFYFTWFCPIHGNQSEKDFRDRLTAENAQCYYCGCYIKLENTGRCPFCFGAKYRTTEIPPILSRYGRM